MTASPQHPYQDPNRPIDERLADLMSRMTLEEKLGQLNQVFAQPQDEDSIKPIIRQGGAGSRILATSWHAGSDEQQAVAYQTLQECQRIAVEETRLGIPLIYGRDVIHGHVTIFPVPLGQAASWDPEAVEAGSAIAAKEAAADYVHWTFAPMLDIARDPRWGRIIEGCGEDPWLCRILGAAMVRGFQGDDPSAPDRILACAKHFAGYGAAEGGRDYNTVEITENTLRNIYLPPFKAAVDAGVGTIMCAFHDLNGRPCSTNSFLLDTILRKEWGFKGFVVSDWASIEDTARHGTSADHRDAAAQAITAGVNMEMVYNCYAKHLKSLLEDGTLTEERINELVAQILAAKFRIGLFEKPYTENGLQKTVHLRPEHRACARRLAARGMVLLKNNASLLPLDSENCGRTALIGPFAQNRRDLLGNWTLDGRAEDTVTILEGIQAVAPDIQHCPAGASADTEVRLAAQSDTVVIAVGEDFLRNGEDANVADLTLPPGQEALIEAVHRLGKRIVLVVCSGRPLVLTRIEPMVDAILWAWHPGTEGGNAVADILFGAVNPSGRLPVTFPRATGQVPIYYNYKNTGRPVNDYFGTDTRYQDIPGAPLYRFGYGLSYTTFEYKNLELDRETVAPDGSLNASVTVTNTGNRAGESIAQLYLRDVVASTVRPVRELKGFQRVALEPGESKRISFAIDREAMEFYGIDGTPQVEPGAFDVWIGPDSSAQLHACFTVDKP